MEKDIGKIPKNDMTDILIRLDDFGGRPGVTIREFVTSDKYTGFTKAGTRIPADKFLAFRELINTIKIEDLKSDSTPASSTSETKKSEKTAKRPQKKIEYEETEI